MFKEDLKQKLQKIFDFKKVTYDSPSESFEQDVLFIEINRATSRVTDKKVTSRVEGTLVCYSQGQRLPFGFFNKQIEKAPLDLKKDLYFFDFDENPENSPARLQNIYERRTNFIFLFSTQYDPNKGSLTSLKLE